MINPVLIKKKSKLCDTKAEPLSLTKERCDPKLKKMSFNFLIVV